MAPLAPEEARSANLPTSLPKPAGLPQISTDAIEAFSCVAEACEDTCCRDWAVALDKPSLDGLKKKLSRTPEGRDRLVKLVVIGRPSKQSGAQIQIQMNDQGACPLLEPNNLCSVHAQFGEEALSTTCSVFPRTALAVEGQLEVNASLGCPEVTRKVLLADHPQHLRPASKPMLPRAYVGKTINGDPSDVYAHQFLRVRALMQRLFHRREFPISTRLIAAAHFADRVRDFFYAGTEVFREDPLALRQLEAEISAAESASLLRTLHADLGSVDGNKAGQASAALVATVLRERRQLAHAPRFAELLDAAAKSLGEEPTRAWQTMETRRMLLEARLGERSTQIFGNYCDHFLLRHPYTDSRTLLDYLFKLGVHLGAVRFLTLAHPTLAERLAGAPDRQADQACFDKVAVHVTQTFTKAIAHQVDFLDAAFANLLGPTGVGFGRLVVLAKFL